MATQARSSVRLGVERGLLVRVLAVPQRLLEVERRVELIDPVLALAFIRVPVRRRAEEVVGDGAVVQGDPLERDDAPAGGGISEEVWPSLFLSSSRHSSYCSNWVDDDRHRVEVLGRRTDHARAADVDVLDRLGLGHARLRHRLLERVEVAHHEVDLRQLVLGERRHVLRLVPLRQQPGVDGRVERLHPAVEDLGEAGQLGHVLHRQPGVGQGLAGAAGGDQLDAVLCVTVRGRTRRGRSCRRRSAGRGGSGRSMAVSSRRKRTGTVVPGLSSGVFYARGRSEPPVPRPPGGHPVGELGSRSGRRGPRRGAGASGRPSCGPVGQPSRSHSEPQRLARQVRLRGRERSGVEDEHRPRPRQFGRRRAASRRRP